VESFVVVGPGQLGRLYAGGALRLGRQVTPVRRGDDVEDILQAVEKGAPVLIATGEAGMPEVASRLPADRKDDAILVQNELFASVWEAAGLRSPTVAVVWLSSKPGRPLEVARPTALWGRHATLMADVHEALGLPCAVVDDKTITLELVAKFAFILGINTLGLEADHSLAGWLREDETRVRSVMADAVTLGAALGGKVDEGAAVEVAKEAMIALGEYPAAGRSAPARKARAKAEAERLGLSLASFG
jgi:hypothetical protein